MHDFLAVYRWRKSGHIQILRTVTDSTRYVTYKTMTPSMTVACHVLLCIRAGANRQELLVGLFVCA
jgi:hypothetical protein